MYNRAGRGVEYDRAQVKSVVGCRFLCVQPSLVMHTKPFQVDPEPIELPAEEGQNITLSVETPLCPCAIAYRRACGLCNQEINLKSAVWRVDPKELEFLAAKGNDDFAHIWHI